MINQTLIEKYAKLVVTAGVNIQKGQMLVIKTPVIAYEFARLCQNYAYQQGASKVEVVFTDEVLAQKDYLYADQEILKNVPNWIIEREGYFVEHKSAFLKINTQYPDILKDVDTNLLGQITQATSKALKPFSTYTQSNQGQWCVMAYPNMAWAKKIFPAMEDNQALEALWNAILKACYIDETTDPVEAWKHHAEQIHVNAKKLNEYQFESLHFENELGTNLTIGLPENHLWGGASEVCSAQNCEFLPNIPTEEVFTTPHRLKVNGKVVASKVLSLHGVVVEDFWFEFKDGYIVSYGAKKGKEALDHLLSTDERSRCLGEVALLSYDSPISQMNILFYNTLFDENASCHLAIGASYPAQIQGGEHMSDEELLAKGGNVSSIHVDFMFGSRKMNIVGTLKDKTTVQVFKDGNFVI